MELTEKQKEIARLLYQGPRTREEIEGELGPVGKEIDEMVRLRLVYHSKGKYFLSPRIKAAVENRSFEVEGIGVRMIVEAQGIDKKAVEKALEDIKKKLEGEEGVVVHFSRISEVKEYQGTYSGYVEADIEVTDLPTLVRVVFFYGPSVVEVERPEKLTVDLADLQEAVLTVAEFVQGYVALITNLMTEKEIREFNRQVLERIGKG